MTTAIIIVSYRTPDDVADCLRAIDRLDRANAFGVYVVENGGAEAYAALRNAVGRHCGAVIGGPDALQATGRHLDCATFRLPVSTSPVWIAQADQNLGYAGGVNSWLENSAAMARWSGFWVLNPDTAPEPKALSGLVMACEQADRGMAGSIILDYTERSRIVSRGLRWRPWRGDVFGVDRGRQLSLPVPKPDSEVDAPSGTSMYLTRACLERIGLMNEDYFLYFEDLDWGIRAKASGQLCHADGSFVPHKYGSSMGSATKRANRSILSVYLDTRNTLLFTRQHNPRLFLCAVARSLVRAAEYLAVGSARNCRYALAGLMAGLKGETGRPSWLV